MESPTTVYNVFKKAKIQIAIDDYNCSEPCIERQLADVLKKDSPYYKMISGFCFESLADILRRAHYLTEKVSAYYRLCEIENDPSLEDCLMYEATRVIVNAISTFKDYEGDTFYYEGPWYVLKKGENYTLHYTIEDSY